MRISLRNRKACYVVATTLCAFGAVGMIVWAAQPLDIFPTMPANHPHVTPGSIAPPDNKSEPSHEAIIKLCDRPLRRPLYDPPPPKPEVRQLPPLSLELLGTIIEDANSMVIVRSDQGSVQYKRIGDAVGPPDSPANIVEINSNSMVVERAKERITLKVKSKELR